MEIVRISGMAALCFFLVSTIAAQEAFRAPASALDSALGGPVVVQSPDRTGVESRASSASITVTTRDLRGAVVAGVQMTLLEQNGTVVGVGMTDSQGELTFGGLSPGAYQVKLIRISPSSSISTGILLGAGETRQLALLAPEPTTTTIDVVATLNQVAEAQVEAQEKQRVLGILPNFYVSYIWNAAPMTPKLKFRLALRSVMDPITFLVTAGVAGAEQAHKTFPGYEQEAEGYARRFGSAYADTVIGAAIGRAILPSILHQDPRYFYQGSGSFGSRLLYAVSQAVICRGDNGRPEPNYSGVLGSFAAAGVSNLYRAPGDRSATLTLRNGLIVVGSSAVVNVLREFLSRKATPTVPAFANGKP